MASWQSTYAAGWTVPGPSSIRRASSATSFRRIDEHADAIVPALAFIRPRPMTVEVDGEVWTLTADEHGVAIVAREADAKARVALRREQLGDLVDDQQTFMSLWASGALDQKAGTVGHLLDWWLVLRAALDGTPIYTPGSVALDDPDGRPLDLARTFRPDDDPAEMRHFLETAGYLHIEGLFDEAEMDAISADMDRAAPTYREGDGRSWWARTDSGDTRLVRMQGFDRESDGARAITRGRAVPRPRVDRGSRAPVRYQTREQQDRGAVQADRGHRGHLRHPVAQGLRDRSALLRLLRADRRHLGDGRRRGLRPAVGDRRLASRARVVGNPPARSRPAGGAARHEDRRRHDAPELHDAHGAAARRARAPGHVQRLRPAPARDRRHRSHRGQPRSSRRRARRRAAHSSRSTLQELGNPCSSSTRSTNTRSIRCRCRCVTSASSDRNVYDRCIYQGVDHEADAYFITGMGVYPNLGVMDAYATVRRGDKQWAIRTSGVRPDDKMSQQIGPYRIEVIKPFHELRLICDADEQGIGFDLVYRSEYGPISEPQHIRRQGDRILLEASRFAGVGTFGRRAARRRRHDCGHARSLHRDPRPFVGHPARSARPNLRPAERLHRHVVVLDPAALRRLRAARHPRRGSRRPAQHELRGAHVPRSVRAPAGAARDGRCPRSATRRARATPSARRSS